MGLRSGREVEVRKSPTGRGDAWELPNKVTYQRRRLRQLQAKLTILAHAQEKEKHNRTATSFICKVALSKPSNFARGLADAFRDLVGASLFPRNTISNIRDAFVQFVTEMCLRCLRVVSLSTAGTGVGGAAASSVGSAAALVVGVGAARGVGSAALFVVAVLHIHDEAGLRLRSCAGSTLCVPERSRP